MNHYQSWSGLNKQLSCYLCKPLENRITYFLTRYHKVHNAYGRAVVLLDKKEMVSFSWTEMYQQEHEISELYALLRTEKNNDISYDEGMRTLRQKWDNDCTYCEMDFLSSATDFLQMPITDALNSDNNIIRMFAILDKRVGKRTLQVIKTQGEYKKLPVWVRQFYELRFVTIATSFYELSSQKKQFQIRKLK